jgi:hypothetical protein
MSEAFQFPWTPTDAFRHHATVRAGGGVRGNQTETPRPAPGVRHPSCVARTGTAPDWLHHHLTISGPEEILEISAAAARGAGVTPWRLDTAAIEEDIFVWAVSQPASQRNLTVEGCWILARQFRERVESRQARAAALVGHSQNCPFDLHALLPVPELILLLGPTDPAALPWLATHWGVTDRLRQVTVCENATTGRRLPNGHAVIGYEFFTDGETPRAAVAQLEQRWPEVRFFLQPRPAA